MIDTQDDAEVPSKGWYVQARHTRYLSILDADSRVIWMNPAMADMIGQPREAVLGRTPRVAVAVRNPEQVVLRACRSCYRGG